MITPTSPLSFNQLDEEANMLRTQLVTQLYSAEYVTKCKKMSYADLQ
jgi:hypothetical protein